MQTATILTPRPTLPTPPATPPAQWGYLLPPPFPVIQLRVYVVYFIMRLQVRVEIMRQRTPTLTDVSSTAAPLEDANTDLE
jgi:hypothetical protein